MKPESENTNKTQRAYEPPEYEKPDSPVGVRSLQELIDIVSGRNIETPFESEDSGIAETLPFPFLGLVGQKEMKLALLLNLINPTIGGVLLLGPRGTGKTTAARSLVDLLPFVERSLCRYGCLPEDIEAGGMDAVCPDCAKKYGEGKPISRKEQSRLVELPLNARLEDVVGGIDERAAIHQRLRLKRGLLAQADRNILYVDEVNLLSDEIIDAILDASAQGRYTVRRGPLSATYKARLTLIGSMNPEEGNLRPQILDRFGLRVIVRGLQDTGQRMQAYQRAVSYRNNPHKIIEQYAEETLLAREEIQTCRQKLPQVTIPEPISRAALDLIRSLKIDSLRAEIALFEAARAYAAADNRDAVSMNDVRIVAPIALRLRTSTFIAKYFSEHDQEEKILRNTMDEFIPQS